MFVALYVAVCVFGVAASLVAPTYRSGDLVEGSLLNAAVKLAPASDGDFSPYFDELFAVVKLQDDTLLMDAEPVPLAPLLEEVSAACAVEAAARGIRVVCTCASYPVAWGDETWLGRAFQNLVANAVNFSKPSGSVEVGLDDDGKTATVTVTDHGTGIDPAEIDKVFDRYYRTAKERTSRRSSGLGLSIAQGVVQRHGGTIAVESELGRGTTFTVTLPVWVERGV